MKSGPTWEWTASKETAALLLAEDSLSIPQIAKQLHLSEKTIDRWKQHPDFKSRIEANVAAFRTRFLEYGLARKENRIAALTDLFRRQQLILQERGASLEMQSVPGGKSGLMCVTWRQLGQGEEAQLIPEYAADTGLSREIRGTLDQVSVELGQKSEKHELEVKKTYDAGRLGELTDDELGTLIELSRKLVSSGGAGSGAPPAS